MLQTTRTFVLSLAALVFAGTVAPTSAHAWPFGKALHLHPRARQAGDPRITVSLFNQNDHFQEVAVAGVVYTVMPHDSITIKAPSGTDVFAHTANVYHRKGDLLFSINPTLSAKTVSIR